MQAQAQQREKDIASARSQISQAQQSYRPIQLTQAQLMKVRPGQQAQIKTMEMQRSSGFQKQVGEATSQIGEAEKELTSYKGQLKTYLDAPAGKLQFAKETGIKPSGYSTIKIGDYKWKVPEYKTPYGTVKDTGKAYEEARKFFKSEAQLAAPKQPDLVKSELAKLGIDVKFDDSGTATGFRDYSKGMSVPIQNLGSYMQKNYPESISKLQQLGVVQKSYPEFAAKLDSNLAPKLDFATTGVSNEMRQKEMEIISKQLASGQLSIANIKAAGIDIETPQEAALNAYIAETKAAGKLPDVSTYDRLISDARRSRAEFEAITPMTKTEEVFKKGLTKYSKEQQPVYNFYTGLKKGSEKVNKSLSLAIPSLMAIPAADVLSERYLGKPEGEAITSFGFRKLDTAVGSLAEKAYTPFFKSKKLGEKTKDITVPSRDVFSRGTKVEGKPLTESLKVNAYPTPVEVRKTASTVSAVGTYFLPYVGQAKMFGPTIEAAAGGAEGNLISHFEAHPEDLILLAAVGGAKAYSLVKDAKAVKETGLTTKELQTLSKSYEKGVMTEESALLRNKGIRNLLKQADGEIKAEAFNKMFPESGNALLAKEALTKLNLARTTKLKKLVDQWTISKGAGGFIKSEESLLKAVKKVEVPIRNVEGLITSWKTVPTVELSAGTINDLLSKETTTAYKNFIMNTAGINVAEANKIVNQQVAVIEQIKKFASYPRTLSTYKPGTEILSPKTIKEFGTGKTVDTFVSTPGKLIKTRETLLMPLKYTPKFGEVVVKSKVTSFISESKLGVKTPITRGIQIYEQGGVQGPSQVALVKGKQFDIFKVLPPKETVFAGGAEKRGIVKFIDTQKVITKGMKTQMIGKIPIRTYERRVYQSFNPSLNLGARYTSEELAASLRQSKFITRSSLPIKKLPIIESKKIVDISVLGAKQPIPGKVSQVGQIISGRSTKGFTRVGTQASIAVPKEIEITLAEIPGLKDIAKSVSKGLPKTTKRKVMDWFTKPKAGAARMQELYPLEKQIKGLGADLKLKPSKEILQESLKIQKDVVASFEVESGSISKSIQTPITKQSVSQLSSLGLVREIKLTQPEKQVSILSSELAQVSPQDIKVSLAQTQPQAMDLVSKTAQLQKPELRSRLLQPIVTPAQPELKIEPAPVIRPPTIIIPRIIIKPKPTAPIKEVKAPSVKKPTPKAFIVTTKKAKREVEVSRVPLAKGEALYLGQKVARGTARASFRLREVKSAPKTLGLPSIGEGQLAGLGFRAPIKRGVPQVGKDIYVQRRSLRISSPGEIREITRKGISTRKAKKSRNKIW